MTDNGWTRRQKIATTIAAALTSIGLLFAGLTWAQVRPATIRELIRVEKRVVVNEAELLSLLAETKCRSCIEACREDCNICSKRECRERCKNRGKCL